jgi:hypothetical protein
MSSSRNATWSSAVATAPTPRGPVTNKTVPQNGQRCCVRVTPKFVTCQSRGTTRREQLPQVM